MEKVSVFCKRSLLALLNGIQRNASVQRALVVSLMALFFAAALYLRIAFSYDVVFGGEWVKFTGIDAYWHIRIVDSVAHNFPYMSSVDPYLLYPYGGGTSIVNPFFDYLLSGIVWVVGLGSPTQHTVDMLAPYFPPVLGALTIIPAYVIGKTLWSRWAGLIAAMLVAVLPGEFLGRSILGFTDHHVAETLFSATAVMFLVLALKNAKRERMTWSHLRHPRANLLAKPLTYALLGGVFLGLYLASWMGALLFVFIIACFFLVQFCVDHLREVPADYLGVLGVATFLPALVVFLLLGQGGDIAIVLALAVVMPVALFILSRLMSHARLKPLLYPASLLVLGLAAYGLAYAVDRSLVQTMQEHFVIFKWNTGTMVSEMIPFVWDNVQGSYSLKPFWQVYGYTMVFAVMALCLLGYRVFKNRDPEKVLVMIWTVVMLLATLAQRRFNYYLVVNVALLTGYASWGILWLVGLKALSRETVAVEDRRKPKRSKKRELQRLSNRINPAYASVALTAIVMFALFTITPYTRVDLYGTGAENWVSMIDYAKRTADRIPDQPQYEPPDAWCESLTWLKDHTPEPFGDPDYYYARYETPLDYSKYPDAYGVMAWWDYGYWIARIGHRPPVQNPGGGIPAVAEFFIAQDEASGAKVMDQFGAKYVILDSQFILYKLYGAMQLTGRSTEEYYDYFLVEATSSSGTTQYKAAQFYFPEYYRTMSVRLYTFGGKAVTPAASDCKVITWEWQTIEGAQYKVVTDTKAYDTYEAAQTAIAGKRSGNYKIVSSDPSVSPVPLEELKGFILRHDSDATVRLTSSLTASQVRIFEYVG